MPASLRIEIFHNSLPTAISFYTKVLRFKLLQYRPSENYAYFQRDAIFIGTDYRADDPATLAAYRKPPTGVEVVIEVDDVDDERQRILDAGWELDADMKLQDWGLRDFRIRDPFGYYLRITHRRVGGEREIGVRLEMATETEMETEIKGKGEGREVSEG